jgi:hypothetical protein
VFFHFGFQMTPAMATVGVVRLEPAKLDDTGHQARMVVRKFVEARDLDSRLALVRDPSRDEPITKRYYGKVAEKSSFEVELSDRHWEETVDHNTELIWLECLVDGAPRDAVVKKTASGLKLDWESFVT